jgi:Uma2 family endonuclease
MRASAATLLTFREFEQLPERPGKSELLRGELIELPPAKKKHHEISKRLFVVLNQEIEKRRTAGADLSLGEAFHEMGYRVARDPDSWLQPGVSVTHPGQAGDDYYEGAPLLAVEVVSESNTPEQLDGKVREYLSHGSREVWIVFPKTRSVWVYRGSTAARIEDSLTTELLPSWSLAVSTLLP